MNDDPGLTGHGERVRVLLAHRYVIEGEIGRGGMAVVLKARDERLGRMVAIKVLRPELAVALGSKRFLREIEISAQLHHPHILPLLNSGQVEDVIYFTMPYVEGESLHDRLVREKQLPIEEAVLIAREVGRGLAYAHEQGVVHRDIKPGNVLLSSGHALIGDFGIASAISHAGVERLTSTGLALGTPAYASPEQASGGGEMDARSDIYSLGCVLYEMLAGEPPFSGRTAQVVLARHMVDPPPSVEAARPSVPPHVAAALDRALAKTPADRFQNANDFVRALEAADTAPVLRRAGPLPKQKRSSSIVKIAVATIGVAAAIGIPFAIRARAQTYDPNTVVYFPLEEQRLGADDAGTGYEVALAVEGALVYADPLRLIDGRLWLTDLDRDVIATPPIEVQKQISRDRGARYFLSGAVVGKRDNDSVTVILRLHDVQEDLPLEEAVREGPLREVALLGVDALKELVPRLVDPGREVDLTPIMDRDAAAVALWVQGEREYRRSHFEAALDLYQRAIEADSALALAAVKGAQAANWLEETRAETPGLLAVALKSDSLLPSRYSHFAHGFDAYLRGDPDSAIARLELALDEVPDWSEAHHLIGEARYHLIPSGLATDEAAEAAFLAALGADSSFSPPIYHVAEIALRWGNLDRAAELIETYRRFDPPPMLLRKLELIRECLQRGPDATEWPIETPEDLVVLRRAGAGVAGGAANWRCSEAALDAFLDHSDFDDTHWGVMLRLQGLLVAQGRVDEAIAIVDSATTIWGGAAKLFLIDELAGASTGSNSRGYVDYVLERYGIDSLLVETHWVVGVWHLEQGDFARARRSYELISDSARIEGTRKAVMLAGSFAAHMALAEGDTAGAIAAFRKVKPTAPKDSLWWQREEPLPLDRLRLSELLLATGEYEEAIVVASGFDHHEIAVYLPFVPRSLLIRLEAARALRRDDLVARYRERLEKLGRDDLLEAIEAP